MLDLDPDTLRLGVAWYVVFVFSLTLHEAAHAFAAWRLGDPTAYYGGQVTLNPAPHIAREPMGTVFIPIISYLFAGWMFGFAHAPYDPYWADRHPRRAGLMALAGPVANLLLVVLAAIAVRVGLALDVFRYPQSIEFERLVEATGEGLPVALATLVSILFTLNLLLLVFNLLPLPPLDGAAVLPLFLPEAQSRRVREFMMQPHLTMIGILMAWLLIGQIFRPIHLAAINLVYLGVASYG